MNNTMKSKFAFFIVISALYGLSACSSQSTVTATSPNDTEMTSTEFQTSTPQHAISQSVTPTITVSPTIRPTWTPLATLSTEQAHQAIRELILNNGGCQIPCWWGIIPGKTSVQEALHFLAPFSTIKQGGSGSFYEGGKTHFTTTYTVYYDIFGEDESGRLDVGVQDNIVVGITAYPLGNEQNYQLSQILTSFGKPSQVYVSAQPYSQTNELLPAKIILDYSKLGILASYEFHLSKSGDNLDICPRPIGARLELRDPIIKYPQALSVEEYVSMITGFDPKRLEDVSETSIDEFYEIFQRPDNTTCLRTPVNLWP
jgi:hypothetical protein